MTDTLLALPLGILQLLWLLAEGKSVRGGTGEGGGGAGTEGKGEWPCGRWRGGEFVIVGEELEARTYKRMRAVGVSPLAEVHSGQNPGVAGHAWVSGRSGRGMAGQGSSERGLGEEGKA